MIAAIAIMVIGAFIAIAIFSMSMSSADGSRTKLESLAAEQLSRDAGTVLAAIYSTGGSGEFDGFVPSADRLRPHAAQLGGQVIANSALTGAMASLAVVDAQRVPAAARVTVTQPLQDGRTGYWQVLAARLPTWGTTAGGRVTVYVRTWTAGNASAPTKPLVHRLEFRPAWFADWQMLFDGPFWLGSTAQLNGRVHSNGYKASFFGTYDTMYEEGAAIRLDAGARCVGNARLSTSALRIDGNLALCPAANRVTEHVPRVNLLRAHDVARHLRPLCGAGHTGLTVVCLPGAGVHTVRLQGNRVIADGRPYMANVAGDRPGDHQGVVVIADGDVRLGGALGPRARALVFASSPNGQAAGSGSAPSIILDGSGSTQVGVSNAAGASSSFGAVADGDVIFDERSFCPATYRGAMVAISGIVSMHPEFRTPIYTATTPKGTPCRGNLAIEGSIVAHFPPSMYQPPSTLNSGYHGLRRYGYLGSLFDNPPPMFPTASDWAMVTNTPANLDCFEGGALTDDAGCK